MDINTTQIQNSIPVTNSNPVATSTTATTGTAKNESGKSFVEEMNSIPEAKSTESMEVLVTNTLDTNQPIKTTETVGTIASIQTETISTINENQVLPEFVTDPVQDFQIVETLIQTNKDLMIDPQFPEIEIVEDLSQEKDFSSPTDFSYQNNEMLFPETSENFVIIEDSMPADEEFIGIENPSDILAEEIKDVLDLKSQTPNEILVTDELSTIEAPIFDEVPTVDETLTLDKTPVIEIKDEFTPEIVDKSNNSNNFENLKKDFEIDSIKEPKLETPNEEMKVAQNVTSKVPEKEAPKAKVNMETVNNELIQSVIDQQNALKLQNTVANKPIEVEISKDKANLNPMVNKTIQTQLDNNNKKAENKKAPSVLAKNDSKVEQKDIAVAKIEKTVEAAPVKAVENAQLAEEEMIVLKAEFANPLKELDSKLITEKTSDVIKLINESLSSPNTTKAKSTSSESVSSNKSEEKSLKMTESDVKFFTELVENNQQVAQSVKAQEQNNIKNVQEARAAQVSKALLEALKESQETNKSFRVDFDKDLSVILKVNKSGQISADFIPGDKAVEQYLKSNIPLLKQKFEDEGLNYDSLSYRHSKKEKQEERKENRRNNKENGYE